MSENIVYLNQYTNLPVPVDRVCESAKSCDYVFIAGYDREGNLYFASSDSDKQKILFLLESFKFKLMNGDFN